VAGAAGTGPHGESRSHVDAPGADALQVTNLPLDVGSFRVSPKGDRIVVSVEVYLDCATSPAPSSGSTRPRMPSQRCAVQQLFVRHWDTWSDGRRSQLFAMALDDVARGHAGESHRRHRRCARQALRRPRRLRLQSRRRAGRVLGARRGGEAWSTNFDIYEVPAAGGTPRI
jgi:dipeptidyl aminopeptidase/acylaminoacyl peptidase